MKFNKLASTALQLKPEDRAALAMALWDSLEDPGLIREELSDEEATTLALERSREIERGDVQALDHAELMQQFKSNKP